jgi:hypothetical protein
MRFASAVIALVIAALAGCAGDDDPCRDHGGYVQAPFPHEFKCADGLRGEWDR